MSIPAANLDQGAKQADSVLSELRQGPTKLERSCTLRLKSKPIKARVTKILLGQARSQKLKGFSQRTKVVPQAFRRRHERALVQEMLLSSASPALASMLKDAKLAIMPGLALGEHAEEGDEYVVECKFELRPQVPPPTLEGIKLRKPVIDVSAAQVAKILARVREQHASYAAVDRAARPKDRVKAELKGSERTFIVDHPQTPPPLSQAVAGKAAGDTVVIKPAELGPVAPNAKAEDVVFTLKLVEEPSVPELSLEFVRRFIPKATSIDEFKAEFKEQLQAQGDSLARQVMVGRAADALERATAEFELPQRLIELYSKERLDNITTEAQQRNLDVSKIDADEVRALVAHEVRTALVLNQYATANAIEVAADELKAKLDELVASQQDPAAFRRQLQENPNQLRQLEESMVRGKVSASLYEACEVEEVTMALDELERIVQGEDPETRRVRAPAAGPAGQEEGDDG